MSISSRWKRVTAKKLWGIDISEGIDFYTNEDEKKLKLHINYPLVNMQDDKAAFEAWSLIFHSKMQCEISLSFNELCWDGSLGNSSAQIATYMRFLYRVWKFNEQMPWFSIEDENRATVDTFKEEFLKLKNQKLIINNRPDEEAKLSQSERKNEHFFENTFVRVPKAQKILKTLVDEKDGTRLKNIYNQLPNGLFKGDKQKDIKKINRIFPTGFLDMWSISEDNELCIFELKVVGDGVKDVRNKSVGIISELFFYANYCKDIFLDRNCNEKPTNYRGYEELIAAVQKGIPKLKAYFLAPEYHPRIEENIKAIQRYLNSNSVDIEYAFLKHDYDQVVPLVEELISENID